MCVYIYIYMHRPFMQWAVRHSSYPKFTDAIALAEAQYVY